MYLSKEKQMSFTDAGFICEDLIPRDSFYRKFRNIVWTLIDDEMFSSMYCLDNGRPAISPALLAMATILQFHKNLSDREMERTCMFDIEVKYALGLKLDERPFDHSSLGDFRKRLLDNNKQKEVFDRILQELVDQELIGKTEIQRIDATHVIADVAIPTMVTMVKKGVREIIKPLRKRHKKAHKAISELIDLSQYDRKSVNHDADGRLDIEKRQRLLVDETLKGDKFVDLLLLFCLERDRHHLMRLNGASPWGNNMPRIARGLADGHFYHVLNCGNGRQNVFHKDGQC